MSTNEDPEEYQPLYKENDLYDCNDCFVFWDDHCPGDALYCEAWMEVKDPHKYTVHNFGDLVI